MRCVSHTRSQPSCEPVVKLPSGRIMIDCTGFTATVKSSVPFEISHKRNVESCEPESMCVLFLAFTVYLLKYKIVFIDLLCKKFQSSIDFIHVVCVARLCANEAVITTIDISNSAGAGSGGCRSSCGIRSCCCRFCSC
jgi:hypothetical protein